MTLRAPVLPLLSLVLQCASHVPASAQPPPPKASVPGARAPGGSPLVCAGDFGIFVSNADGTERRRIGSSTGAAAPRFLPGGREIVFVHEGRALRRLDLTSGSETHLAGPWQTSVSCADGSRFELAIHADENVELDEKGRYACIQLSDRNVNMATVASSVRVDLTSGTFEQRTTLGLGACAPHGVSESFACRGKAEPHPAPLANHPYEFDEVLHSLRGPSRRVIPMPADFRAGETSPDGRWLLLWGNQEDGDYIHNNLFLFDRVTGTLTPVPDPYGAAPLDWPKPLDEVELREPSRERLGARAGDFVGETPVRFLDSSRLVAGELLLLLDARKISVLCGDVAR